jgi:hypothetical protein
LFGSVARREGSVGSDVDLFFDTDNPRFSPIVLVDVHEWVIGILGTETDDDTSQPPSDDPKPNRRGGYALFDVQRRVLFRLFDIRDTIGGITSVPLALRSTPSPTTGHCNVLSSAGSTASPRRTVTPWLT